MESSEIFYRAPSPDNDREIEGIVSLFRKAYDKDFPVREVYDPQFWKSRIGTRHVSFIAVTDDGNVLAHIAAHPDRDNPRHIQLCMPALDPEARERAPELLSHLWKCVERQANRQQWALIYKFLLGSLVEVQHAVGEVFDFCDVAIYPGSSVPLPKKNGKKQGKVQHKEVRPPVLVTQKIMEHEPVRQKLTVHVPRQHLEMCQFLYEPLPLARNFCTRADGDASSCMVSADARAVERIAYRHTGLCQLYVQPSLVHSYDEPFEQVDTRRFDDTFVFVNLFDCQAPHFCEFLENRGYRFCGVVPLLHGRDSIVFSQGQSSMMSEELFSAPRAKALARYIESYDFDKSVETNTTLEASSAYAG